MSASPSVAGPAIRSEPISEALRSASVGSPVWDEDRRYIAADAAACEVLGTTLEELGMPLMATVIAPLPE